MRSAGHRGCNGGDGGLLDAGVECTGTIRAAVAAHQPGALQSGPGKEDRSKGRNAYRRTPAGRSSGRQLRAPG